ncbi:MAG: hypothetical protein GXO49_05495, partial [Chlorobi bacterium]|nr:hypothetical protein [Chlorobiota bacterium]
MKTNLFKILAIFFAFGMFALTSCDTSEPDQQSAEDDARGGYMMADAFAVSNDNTNDDGGKALLVEGMEIERSLLEHKVKITFSNCDYRGAKRNGVINIAYDFALEPSNLGAYNLVITFEDYTVDGVGLEGTITTTFGGIYDTPAITIVGTGMVATFSNGETISWNSSQVYTLEGGFVNGLVGDTVVVSGTSEGVNRKGESFKSTYANVTLNRACED